MSKPVKMKVDAGVCRFVTTIVGVCEDGMTVNLTIESDCPSVKKLAANLKEADVMGAIKTPVTENPVHIACCKDLEHAACVIPSALVKVCEAAGGMALKKDASFQFQ